MNTNAFQLIIINIAIASESMLFKKSLNQKAVETLKLESMLVQNGFKCLKLIINNYMQQLGQSNYSSLFDCIQIYSQAKTENINSNLTAIGMFMSIADYLAKISRE